jgi:hypothetical protein
VTTPRDRVVVSIIEWRGYKYIKENLCSIVVAVLLYSQNRNIDEHISKDTYIHRRAKDEN